MKLFVCVLIMHLANANNYIDDYEVPKPVIEVLSPRGLKVSIPHTEGVKLFAFHGNINEPMNGLEAGQFSKDILRKNGNRWIFYDKHAKINDGDVIYYWLYVIKGNLGHRYDNGVYKYSGPSQQHENALSQPTRKPTSNEGAEPSEQEVENKRKCDLLYNITETVSYLYNELRELKETNKILTDIAERDPEGCRELRFNYVPQNLEDDAKFIAQNIITQKLKLQVKVVKATREPNDTIKFEVATLNDKIALIKAAQDKLKNSKISLTY